MKKTALFTSGELFKTLFLGYDNIISINDKIPSHHISTKNLHMRFDDEEIGCCLIAIKHDDSFYKSNFKEAVLIETSLLGDIIEYFSSREIPIVLLSTVEVFDGTQIDIYSEEDVPNPITPHGMVKLESEKFVLENARTSFAIRLPWTYSVNSKDSFPFQIINAFLVSKSVNVFEDQLGNMMNLFDLEQVMVDVINCCSSHSFLKMIKNDSNRIYHLSPKGFTSKFLISIEIFKALVRSFESIVKTQTINPVSIDGSSLKNTLQKNCCLSSYKFCSTFKTNIPEWHFSLFNASQKILKKIANIPHTK